MKWSKSKYESLYKKYTDEKYLVSDPVEFCRQAENPNDAELIGFVSSQFAYGNVSAMRKFLVDLFKHKECSSVEKLITVKQFKLKSLYYRFQTSRDIETFFQVLKEISQARLTRSGFLFEPEISDSKNSQKDNIDEIRNAFWNSAPITRRTHGYKQLTGFGSDQSARKRYCMFFRWMTRNTFPDLGLYQRIKTENLIIPLDTHIMKISGLLGLRTGNTVNWKTATEITENLKKIQPDDPLKYDFSLTRPGILKEFSSLRL